MRESKLIWKKKRHIALRVMGFISIFLLPFSFTFRFRFQQQQQQHPSVLLNKDHVGALAAFSGVGDRMKIPKML